MNEINVKYFCFSSKISLKIGKKTTSNLRKVNWKRNMGHDVSNYSLIYSVSFPSGVKVEVFQCFFFPYLPEKSVEKSNWKSLTQTWQGWFGWYGPNQGDYDSHGQDGATWCQIDLGSRYWLDQGAVSLSPSLPGRHEWRASTCEGQAM